MTNVFDPEIIASFREKRKRMTKSDCQGERRVIPLGGPTHRMFLAAAAAVDRTGTLRPGTKAIWGRAMIDTVFQAIEADENLEAAIEAFRQKIKQYEKNEVAS